MARLASRPRHGHAGAVGVNRHARPLIDTRPRHCAIRAPRASRGEPGRIARRSGSLLERRFDGTAVPSAGERQWTAIFVTRPKRNMGLTVKKERRRRLHRDLRRGGRDFEQRRFQASGPVAPHRGSARRGGQDDRRDLKRHDAIRRRDRGQRLRASIGANATRNVSAGRPRFHSRGRRLELMLAGASFETA